MKAHWWIAGLATAVVAAGGYRALNPSSDPLDKLMPYYKGERYRLWKPHHSKSNGYEEREMYFTKVPPELFNQWLTDDFSTEGGWQRTDRQDNAAISALVWQGPKPGPDVEFHRVFEIAARHYPTTKGDGYEAMVCSYRPLPKWEVLWMRIKKRGESPLYDDP